MSILLKLKKRLFQINIRRLKQNALAKASAIRPEPMSNDSIKENIFREEHPEYEEEDRTFVQHISSKLKDKLSEKIRRR